MPLKCIVYIGEGTLQQPRQSIPFFQNLVLQLVSLDLDKGRNVTADNFFSSYDLVQDLAERRNVLWNGWNVGMVCPNKKELPSAAKSVKNPRQTRVRLP